MFSLANNTLCDLNHLLQRTLSVLLRLKGGDHFIPSRNMNNPSIFSSNGGNGHNKVPMRRGLFPNEGRPLYAVSLTIVRDQQVRAKLYSDHLARADVWPPHSLGVFIFRSSILLFQRWLTTVSTCSVSEQGANYRSAKRQPHFIGHTFI